MSNDYFISDTDFETHPKFDPVIETGTDASWRATPMSDAGKPKKMPSQDVSMVSARSFLPDIRMPSNVPPEPVGIADMANMFGVTHRTLHFYEEKGIIDSRRSGIMRVYSHQDVRRMAVVTFCRDIGIPIATVQSIMHDLADVTTQAEADALFQTALNARKSELAAEVANVRRQIQQISDILLTDDNNAAGNDEAETSLHVSLTEQEQKCLELMAEGYAPARLASALGVSPEEHETLEARIMEKVSATNRFQAVAKGLMLGLISQA